MSAGLLGVSVSLIKKTELPLRLRVIRQDLRSGFVFADGAIIMAISSGALADVIVFPFAIFSLMIGGGFIAGMLLGILAGILALVRRGR